MKIINHLNIHYNDFVALKNKFQNDYLFPLLYLDNFLPDDLAMSLSEEIKNIDMSKCKIFNRNGSYMEECNDLKLMPEAENVIYQLHSQQGLKWLSDVTGIENILPDPYLIGSGYSKSFNGDSLKNHVDFNWNDKIKLYRVLTLIIYLTPNWNNDWGGHLEFTDFEGSNVKSIFTKFNRAVIWKHHENCFHGYPQPITCPQDHSRNTLRLFFYKSEFQPFEDLPSHRSLYYFDDVNKRPTDKNG